MITESIISLVGTICVVFIIEIAIAIFLYIIDVVKRS